MWLRWVIGCDGSDGNEVKQTLTDRQMDTLKKRKKRRNKKKTQQLERKKNNEEDWKGHLRLN